MRRRVRLLLGFVGLLPTLAVHALEERDLTPPGEFASVETHRLYYRCVGEGSPTVVIDTGIGGAAVEWTRIQDVLAEDTRVCTYDRAGYGWSDPGPSPRTTAREVDELQRLLHAAQIPAPYVLVGHSFGGFNMRYFAATRPAEVAALVLVESSHPRAGMPRVAGRGRRWNPLSPMPPDVAPEAREFAIAHYLNSRRKAVFAQMHEIAQFDASAAEVEAAGPLPDVPLFVLARDPSHGRRNATGEARWQAHQRELSRLTLQGRFATARGSGHEIHKSQPAAVIDTIRAALLAARRAESGMTARVGRPPTG